MTVAMLTVLVAFAGTGVAQGTASASAPRLAEMNPVLCWVVVVAVAGVVVWKSRHALAREWRFSRVQRQVERLIDAGRLTNKLLYDLVVEEIVGVEAQRAALRTYDRWPAYALEPANQAEVIKTRARALKLLSHTRYMYRTEQGILLMVFENQQAAGAGFGWAFRGGPTVGSASGRTCSGSVRLTSSVTGLPRASTSIFSVHSRPPWRYLM